MWCDVVRERAREAPAAAEPAGGLRDQDHQCGLRLPRGVRAPDAHRTYRRPTRPQGAHAAGRPNLKAPRETLIEALTGYFTDHHAFSRRPCWTGSTRPPRWNNA